MIILVVPNTIFFSWKTLDYTVNINLTEKKKKLAKVALQTYCVTLNRKADSKEKKNTFNNKPIFQLHVCSATITYSNSKIGLNLSCRI